MNSPNSPRRKPHPRCTWRISECALYCVSTPIRRMPELMQFDNVKSMIRKQPPNGTAGFVRHAVSSPNRRRARRPTRAPSCDVSVD